jgi:hypothetical protein
MSEILVINEDNIKNKIFTIRGLQVMLDRDLAELYGVEPKRLGEQVKRNIERFPKEFRYQLTEEKKINRSQIATGSSHSNTLLHFLLLSQNKVFLCFRRF